MLLAKPPPATISHDLPGVNKTIRSSQPRSSRRTSLTMKILLPLSLSLFSLLEPHHSPSAFAAAETSCALGPSGFEKFPGPARPLPPPTCLSTKAEADRVTKLLSYRTLLFVFEILNCRILGGTRNMGAASVIGEHANWDV